MRSRPILAWKDLRCCWVDARVREIPFGMLPRSPGQRGPWRCCIADSLAAYPAEEKSGMRAQREVFREISCPFAPKCTHEDWAHAASPSMCANVAATATRWIVDL